MLRLARACTNSLSRSFRAFAVAVLVAIRRSDRLDTADAADCFMEPAATLPAFCLLVRTDARHCASLSYTCLPGVIPA